MASGYVYIMINPGMPKLLKIGHSSRPTEERARELSQPTGVPFPFVVAYEEVFSTCYQEAEQEVHARLEGFRSNRCREFFHLPLKDAITVLREVAQIFRDREEAQCCQPAAATQRETKVNVDPQPTAQPQLRIPSTGGKWDYRT
jgi:hypothetical protein